MKNHICKEDNTCCCGTLAEEPNDNCPVHGCQYPVRCGICGRFMKHQPTYHIKIVSVEPCPIPMPKDIIFFYDMKLVSKI